MTDRKEEMIDCPACGGESWIVDEDGDHEAGCCNNPLDGGVCCGNPIPVPKAIQKMCSFCNGQKKVPKSEVGEVKFHFDNSDDLPF